MKDITLEELLEAGCHFGHQVNRRNPKADEFIFEARSNIHIINLEKTREGLLLAAEYLKELSKKGGNVVFVGTKKQAKPIVEEEIERAIRETQDEQNENKPHIFYVTSRWVGGILTNFEEVSKNFKKLKELRSFLQSEKIKDYTKREVVLFEREKQKLENLYGGIADLDKIPDVLLIIDIHNEETAVKESIKMGVVTVGIVDTNADPAAVNYPIPANDDAVGSIKIIINYLVDAWIEGQKNIKNQISKIKDEEKEQNKKEIKVEEKKEKSGKAKEEKKPSEKNPEKRKQKKSSE